MKTSIVGLCLIALLGLVFALWPASQATMERRDRQHKERMLLKQVDTMAPTVTLVENYKPNVHTTKLTPAHRKDSPYYSVQAWNNTAKHCRTRMVQWRRIYRKVKALMVQEGTYEVDRYEDDVRRAANAASGGFHGALSDENAGECYDYMHGKKNPHQRLPL